MSYQHGAYGEIGNDKVKSAVQVDTVVAYIGTAPINLVLGYKEKAEYFRNSVRKGNF